MADLTWVESPPLCSVASARRHGAADEAAGVSVGVVTDFQLLLVLARQGQAGAMRKTAKARFGADPGTAPRAVAAKNGCTLVWTGPGQFCAITPVAKARTVDALQKAFAKSASLSDQSSSRALVCMSGPRMRDCMAKMVSIDLHPDVFKAGDTAATRMAHMAVNIWRGGNDVFYILVSASFAESLWRTILDHGAEYGVDIMEPAKFG